MRLSKTILSGVIWFGFLGLLIFGISKHQAAYDWYRLRSFQPSPAIANLATADTMNGSTRRVFYVNHPQLVSSGPTFHQDCQQSEQTIVLGCYRSGDGIYLYNVTDIRLDGVEQVTAAHETLHAEYDRLSSKDKKYVDGLLMDYYNNDLHDQRIIDTINNYKKIEPNDVVNEMHSVFGTEISNLPAPLEDYYKRYFTNRQAITAFSANYESEFTSRQSQIAQYDQQLSILNKRIASEEADLDSQISKIDADRSRLDSQRSSGQIAAYNAGVASYNAEISSYNQGVNNVKAEIAQYNDLVETRNSVAAEISALTKSIDSNSAPQLTQ